MQDPLETYVAKLLKAKGEPETEESKSALLDKINDAIDQALIEALPLKQLDELEKATAENRVDDNTIERLLNEVGADPSEIMKKTLDDFQHKYLKGVANE